MTEIKVKKSVALSGVPAGNTALSAVGGADLHYRGYSIKDLAANCQFEEVAYLLVHGDLPTQAQLDAYKAKLKGLRGLSPQVKTVLEQLPASAHAMDVLRTGFSAIGAVTPESTKHTEAEARDIADSMPSFAIASVRAMIWKLSSVRASTAALMRSTISLFETISLLGR